MSYEYIFVVPENTEKNILDTSTYDLPQNCYEELSGDASKDIVPLLRKYGYLDNSWSEDKTLGWQLGDPKHKHEIQSAIKYREDRLFYKYAPYIFEVEKGYDHALKRMSNEIGFSVQSVNYQKVEGTKSTYRLSFVAGGKEYSIKFRPPVNGFPKAFMELIYKVMEADSDGEFLFLDKGSHPCYTFIKSDLVNALEKHGFLRELEGEPKW